MTAAARLAANRPTDARRVLPVTVMPLAMIDRAAMAMPRVRTVPAAMATLLVALVLSAVIVLVATVMGGLRVQPEPADHASVSA